MFVHSMYVFTYICVYIYECRYAIIYSMYVFMYECIYLYIAYKVEICYLSNS